MFNHAGRHLIGKGLRYLKTVRVTAGLYRGLASLERGLTHRQWPRFTEYTKLFNLALSYVFVKQSDPPCHCDPSVTIASGDGHPFSRTYRTILPNSLEWILPNTFAFSARIPVSVLGTIANNPPHAHFHGLQELPKAPIQEPIHTFTRFSSLRDSSWLNA